MSELEPLSDEARELLALAEVPQPPEGAELRVLARLKGALPPVLVPLPPTVSLFGRWGVQAGLASLVAGALLGAALDRALVEPRIETRIVKVQVPAPASVEAPPVVEPVAQPRPAPSRRLSPPSAPPLVKESTADVALARERQLIEQARSALVRGVLPAAKETLDEHRASFPKGRLAEERESLAVQASIRAGDFARARTDAAAFRAAFPESLLLPAIDAALASIPP